MAIFQSRPSQSGRTDIPRRNEAAGLTIIATGTTIVGDVGSEGVVKVEGTIQGTVRAAAQLLVAPGAMVRGDVYAPEIVAGGEIHGTVHAEDRVEIQAGALVDGDIQTQRILIAEGGRVNGQISMEPPGADRSDANGAERGSLSNVTASDRS
jgi:cytoskeletal protein CcmA (bactofilin family)